jgi:hypothetical protein
MTAHFAVLLLFVAALGIYALWWIAMGWINGSTWP